VATHSIAWLIPTTRGRNQLEAASCTIPRRVNTNPNRADSAAIRTSIGSVIVAPMPTAGPLTAAITGLCSAAKGSEATPPQSRGTPPMVSGGVGRSGRSGSKVDPPDRSAPAQNARPAPVTTSTRTSSSASAAAQTSPSSRAMSAVNVLSRSGRCRVSVATPSATA
jgi:hypothetical protein